MSLNQSMLGKRFAVPLALLLAVVLSPPEVFSQRLFLNGGAHLAGQNVRSQLAGTSPAIHGGIQFQDTDYFRVRAAVTSQANLLSVDGLLQLHFLGEGVNVGNDKLNPYLMAGYGYYLSGSGEQGLFPVGAGVEYGLLGNLGVNFEISGRFGVNEVRNGGRLNLNVISGLMPSIGVTYKLQRIDRQRPDAPTLSSEEGPEETTDTENTYVARGNQNASPYADPAGVGGGPVQEFNLPYTVDSLRNADPLIIRQGQEPPFPDPGQIATSGSVTPSEDGTMVRLPDGTFIMGLTDTDPLNRQIAGRKQVTVSSFYLDRFEVTNKEYREFVNSLSQQKRQERLPDSSAWARSSRQMGWETYFYGSTNSDHPVVGVTWSDARAYCKWEGKRLPTEAEWEYAARAGRVGGIYPWSGLSTKDAKGRYLANYNPDGAGQAADGYAFTAPVGTYPPNRWGLHDMAGNVAEWVLDAYNPTYEPLSGMSPAYRDPDAEKHVVRGGSWAASSFVIGVGYRQSQPASKASVRIGFRCAADISSIEGSVDRPSARPPTQSGPPQQAPPPADSVQQQPTQTGNQQTGGQQQTEQETGSQGGGGQQNEGGPQGGGQNTGGSGSEESSGSGNGGR